MARKTAGKFQRKAMKRSREAAADTSATPKESKPGKVRGKRTWKMMDRGATVAGTVLAAQATKTAWRLLSGKKAPKSGRHPDISNREAALYAIVAGALAELVKTSVRRGTATYWVRSTGQLPPGMKPLTEAGPGQESKLEVDARAHRPTVTPRGSANSTPRGSANSPPRDRANSTQRDRANSTQRDRANSTQRGSARPASRKSANLARSTSKAASRRRDR